MTMYISSEATRKMGNSPFRGKEGAIRRIFVTIGYFRLGQVIPIELGKVILSQVIAPQGQAIGPAGLEPLAGASNRRKATVKKTKNRPLRSFATKVPMSNNLLLLKIDLTDCPLSVKRTYDGLMSVKEQLPILVLIIKLYIQISFGIHPLVTVRNCPSLSKFDDLCFDAISMLISDKKGRHLGEKQR